MGTRKTGRGRRRHARGEVAFTLTPRVSPSRAPVLSFAHYFQGPATQASPHWKYFIDLHLRHISHLRKGYVFSSSGEHISLWRHSDMCFPFICDTHTPSYMCSRVGETHFTRDMCSGEHISRRNIYHFDVTVKSVPPIKREDHSLLPDATQRNAERCQAFIKTKAATTSNGRYWSVEERGNIIWGAKCIFII